ncbi:MAG: AAA family ATPase [Acidimicrobiales bacterium]
MELEQLGGARVLRTALADVAQSRERERHRRVRRLMFVLGSIAAWLWIRALAGNPVSPGLPNLPPGAEQYAPAMVLVFVLLLVIAGPMLGAGRSPHVLYRPSEIDTTLDDVKGAAVVVDEVVKTLNLFLAHKTFRDQMGGTPRRAILFEGPPGTGKTYMAKAMASEAGVPFLFVSSSAFQSMYYGQTNRKIRTYFKALRTYARKEGGAIGFIEEIDAIGAARSGMGGGGREGVSGVVNELLIQLQSFDAPPRTVAIKGAFIDFVNKWLPPEAQFRKPKTEPANILLVGATNRKDDLDPALLRPGRFDRSVYFDLPSRAGRREIIDFYLSKKAHEAALDDDQLRDTMAAMTFGYSPVMIEHLLDEALVWAIRRGAGALSWHDIQQARMTEELGLKQPVEYPEDERRAIATHEAGHATVAHLLGKGRKLEVLSIIKRGQALGLLAHSDTEERFTNTESELRGRIDIAMGGMVAEELFFGESGTGPAGDLQTATMIAAAMVGSYGLGGSLISYEAISGPNGNLVAKVVSSDDGKTAVEEILNDSKARVASVLSDNRHLIEALRDELLEHEELLGDDIVDTLRNAELRRHVIDLTDDPADTAATKNPG